MLNIQTATGVKRKDGPYDLWDLENRTVLLNIACLRFGMGFCCIYPELVSFSVQPMKQEESKISEDIFKEAMVRKVWQLARYQAQSNLNGLPDRLFLYKGYLLGIEVKTPTGTPTELQKIKLDMINRNGGIGLLCCAREQFAWVIDAIDSGMKQQDIITNYKNIFKM